MDATKMTNEDWGDPVWEVMTPEQQRIETVLFGLDFQSPEDRATQLQDIQSYIRNSIPKPPRRADTENFVLGTLNEFMNHRITFADAVKQLTDRIHTTDHA